MVLSSELPNLTTLNSDSLTRILELCQQNELSEDQIKLQITDDIKYLISSKLTNNPIPFYNQLQNNDHYKTMVTHGKQTNDAIIQTALKKIQFDIDQTDKVFNRQNNNKYLQHSY